MPRALALATLTVAATGLVATAEARAPAPTRIQVVATEFRLGQSRYVIRSGSTVVELVNSGEDEHDLAMRRVARGAPTLRTDSVLPGGLTRLRARLAPGRFQLWCTLADHRSRGMRATLVVQRPRTPKERYPQPG